MGNRIDRIWKLYREELGPKYDIPVGEDCIERDIGNGFRFQIYDYRRNGGKISCTVYVWVQKPDSRSEDGCEYVHEVEIVHFINVTVSELDKQLNAMARKYVWLRPIDVYMDQERDKNVRSAQFISSGNDIIRLNKNIGKCLKATRQRTGLTKKDLAELSNISLADYKRYENRKIDAENECPAEKLLAIAEALNIPVYEILIGKR